MRFDARSDLAVLYKGGCDVDANEALLEMCATREMNSSSSICHQYGEAVSQRDSSSLVLEQSRGSKLIAVKAGRQWRKEGSGSLACRTI